MNLPGNSTSIVISSNYLIKAKRTEVINIPSIIFPKRGGAIATNKKRRVEDFPIAADLNIMAMTPFEPSTFEYISRWFDSIDLQSLNNGSSVPQINNKDVAPLLLPVPPLAEQRRIVAELDRCLSLVDTVERDGGELEALFRRLRSKVLDLAIRGELTERDPGDEPASELLTCIREEKLAMVARGELKPKDVKNDTVIFTGSDGLRYEKRADGRGEPVCIEDEIPFEIPETWAWARLGSLITLLSGVDLASAQYNDTRLGIPYITGASNFVDGNLLENRWTNQPSRISHRGDLLFTCKGTIGEMAVNEFEEAHIARQIMAITPIENQETQYIEIFLKTMVAQIQSRAKGLIPGIERATLLTALLPVPPLAEQGRIVEKVETIFCQLR